MFGAMDLGIADDGQRARREQAAQIAIALFADTAELVLAPARVLLRHEPDPGRKIPPRSKSLRISHAGDQSGGQRRTDARDLIQPLARLATSAAGRRELADRHVQPQAIVCRLRRRPHRAVVQHHYVRPVQQCQTRQDGHGSH
jgi:hypothetical protein